MSRVAVLAILVVLAALTAPAVVAQSDDSYSIAIENADIVDTPDRTFQGFTISSIAAVSQDESIEVSVSTDANEEYWVTLLNSEGQTVNRTEFNGSDSTSFKTSDLSPGTYVVGVGLAPAFDEIQLVVLEAYETTLSVPSETPQNENITAEISLSETTPAPATVQAVIANEAMNKTIQAEQTSENTYEATISTSYELGEYRVYAVARSDETLPNGQSEIISLSNEHELSITSSDKDDTDPTQDGATDEPAGGGSGSGSEGGGGNAPVSNAPEQTTGTSESDVEDVIQQQSASIEPAPDGASSQVEFEPGSTLESITFTTSDISGLVNVTSTTSVPDAVESPTQPVLQLSEISVPEDARNSSARLRLSVSAERLNRSNATASELQVTRYSNSTWNSLNTSVVNQTPSRVTLEATTPGFSYFAVTATSGSETGSTDSANSTDSTNSTDSDGETSSDTSGSTQSTPTNDTSTSSDGSTNSNTPGFGPAVSVIGLLTASIALIRRQE